MPINVEDLVQTIVWCASRRREKLTTLRLVKFVYLADLYYARYAKGKTLTGLPWAFAYFGPWCKEVNEAIDSATRIGLVLAKEYPSKYDDAKDYRLFWVDDTEAEPKIVEALPTYVWSKLQWAIQKWADDSSGLLDYVYFETEPMIQATPGSRLDFRRAQMPEIPKKIDIRKIPPGKLKEARELLGRLKKKYQDGLSSKPPRGPTDAVFQDFVSKLDEGDLETGLEGSARLGDLDSDRKP